MGRLIEKARRDFGTEVMWAVKPDRAATKADQIALQEKLYAAGGYTPEVVVDHLAEGLVDYKRGRMPVEFGLYRGTSDPTRWMDDATHLAGQRVLMVAGSGEIAERFTAAGVTSLHIMDLSPAAVFMNELRLAAAPYLSLDEYKTLFEPSVAGGSKRARSQPLLDKKIYAKVKDHLTAQARAYFDAIMTPGYEPFFVSSHVRMDNDPIIDRRHNGQIPPAHLKDAASFAAYQGRVAGLEHHIQIGDMDAEPRSAYQFDFAYISNIGFGVKETTALAVKLLKKGAKRVGFTFTKLDGLNPYKVATRPQRVRTGPVLENLLINIGDKVAVKVGNKEVMVHIIDIDDTVGCSYYGEIDSSDVR